MSPWTRDTACKLHGDIKAPGVGSKPSLPLASPETLAQEVHCGLHPDSALSLNATTQG